MTVVSGMTLGMQLLEALGIDNENVTSVSLSCTADGPALITVDRMLTPVEAGAVQFLLDHYTVKEKL